MTDHLKTIREFIDSVHSGEWSGDFDRVDALAALDALEAAMREPVYWQWRRKGQPWSMEYTFNSEVQVTTEDSERRALFTAPPAQQAQPLTRDRVREIFMAHGFTVKNGQADLKPYVYEAAYALLAAAAAAAAQQAQPLITKEASLRFRLDCTKEQLEAAERECAELRSKLKEAQQAQPSDLQLAKPEPLTSYVQPVPDHCDRIVWRNRYYHLPLKQAQAEAVPPTPITDGSMANQRDANRYRWWRYNACYKPSVVAKLLAPLFTPLAIDAAIDAAIAAAPQPKEQSK